MSVRSTIVGRRQLFTYSNLMYIGGVGLEDA